MGLRLNESAWCLDVHLSEKFPKCSKNFTRLGCKVAILSSWIKYSIYLIIWLLEEPSPILQWSISVWVCVSRELYKRKFETVCGLLNPLSENNITEYVTVHFPYNFLYAKLSFSPSRECLENASLKPERNIGWQKQTKNYKCHLTIGYYSAISIVQLFYKVCYCLNIIHNKLFNFIRLLKRLTILVRFQTVNVIIYLILETMFCIKHDY